MKMIVAAAAVYALLLEAMGRVGGAGSSGSKPPPSSVELEGVYESWSPRLFITGSSLLQLLLMALGVCRKSSPSPFINFLAWLAYVTANSLSYFTMVLPFVDKSKTDPRLVVLWASFFLLHSGGVDSLNSCSLEDNLIWKRYALRLILQAGLCAGVVAQCSVGGVLAVAVYPVLGIGVCNCLERIWVHRQANFRNLEFTQKKTSRIWNLPEKNITTSEAHHPLPHQIIATTTSLDATENSWLNSWWRVRDVNVLLLSGWMHRSYGGLYHHRTYCTRLRNISIYFSDKLGLSHKEAFRVAGSEMSLRHDAIYTRAPAMHTTWGWWSRLFSFAFMLGCFMVLALAVDKQGLSPPDIVVTVLLFAVDIFIRSCSLYRMLFSRQTLLHNLMMLPAHSNTNSMNNESNNDGPVRRRFKYFQLKDDKFYVGEFGLLSYALEHPTSRFKQFLANHVRTLDDAQTDVLQTSIFETLRNKSRDAYPADRLMAHTRQILAEGSEEKATVEWSVVDRGLSEICWLWIIATNLIFYSPADQSSEASNSRESLEEVRKLKMIAKQLADYLLYLLKKKPDFMWSAGQDSVMITADTLANLRCFSNRGDTFDGYPDLAFALVLHSQNVNHKKGDSGMSVLWDGCKLGKRLMGLEMQYKTKVEMLVRALVELLSDVSLRCRGELHAQLLGEGRELITFIWWITLLLGFQKHFGPVIC